MHSTLNATRSLVKHFSRICMSLAAAGSLAALTARAEDPEKGLARAWILQAPPARYPEITEVILSESVPQWTPPARLIGFDVSARYTTPWPPRLISERIR